MPATEPQPSTIGKLSYLSWGEFTGSVRVTNTTGRAWEILLYQGRIVWCVDRLQPNRFWQRHLRKATGKSSMTIDLMWQAANEVNPTAFAISSDSCWQYQGAIALLELGKIHQKQLSKILSNSAKEVLFDLIQASYLDRPILQSEPEIFLDRPPILLDTEKVIEAATAEWEEWQQHKLADLSPLLAPKIEHPVQLYRQTTPVVYQNLARAIDGERTLREIALELDQDLMLLSRSLLRYISIGIIQTVELPDIEIEPIVNPTLPPDYPTPVTGAVKPQPKSKSRSRPKLIACIDDNHQICQQVETIVNQAGYRCLILQDPTTILSKLLEKKPDLIFLDLVMPSINGYEICSQIRKVSILSRTPIVIITGRDGLMDRVRAKMVGASDFVNKPLDNFKINSILNKYIRASTRHG
jgi:two-component system, chemotaxis family, response regulator PixG